MSLRPPASALRDFLASEAAGGVVLIAAAVAALLLANIPATASSYAALLHVETGPILNPHLGPMSIHLWINDGLMAVFFLLVGLEIKREIVDGRLARADRRRLPIIAALAGMAVPALVYLSLSGSAAHLTRGWAIPAATDIAFAIGVMALLGRHAPSSLKLFLTTVAIVDDMGAVAIIAIAYTDHIAVSALAAAAAVVALLYWMNRRGVRRLRPYLLGFVALWLLTLMSGVHATIAGVVTALLIPVTRSPGVPDSPTSPLHRLEHALHPWVAFAIVPLFGFANAGVSLERASWAIFGDPLVLGITAGLFVGKQVGIFGSIWLAEITGIARRPAGTSWPQIYGIALLAGIGFTMSLFIGGLAFPGDATREELVKIGVLAGSILSALTGFAVLRLSSGKAV